MSIRLMTWAWDKTDVGGTELLVLLALADWSNDSGKCWYSINRIAERARVSRRQAMRILASLEEKGIIGIDERTRQNGSHTSNVYTIYATECVPEDIDGMGGSDMDDTTPSDIAVSPPSDIAVSPPEPLINQKQDDPLIVSSRPNIFKLYESNIGFIVPRIADILIEAEKDYPEEWISEAFDIAVEQNHRSWSYVNGILRNWKSNGRGGRINKSDKVSAKARDRYGDWEQ